MCHAATAVGLIRLARSGIQWAGMNSDLRERLRRLGMHRGAAHLKPAQPESDDRHEACAPVVSTSDTEALLEAIRTPFGHAYVRRVDYVLTHRHGERMLGAALHHPGERLSGLAAQRAGAACDLHRALFLDTETTGLNGGVGTLAFLVGLGYFTSDRFVVEQFFLRDPAEEAAMLCEVDRRMHEREVIVTFNGRSFDVPLLESRFILSRVPSPFSDKSHLDLLLPARQVWRSILDSCSLGSLEFHLLGVRREQRDIPGSVIPFLYREYLAAGGDLNEDMQRVMYHNLTDILSMVTLVSRLAEALMQPNDAGEHYAAARYYERLGDYVAAEQSYRAVVGMLEAGDWRLSQSPIFDLRASSARRLARLLKRRGNPEEALTLWQRLAESDDVEGLIEVAKHYEWRTCNLDRALTCARRARRVNSNPALRGAIERRIARLERKLQSKP